MLLCYAVDEDEAKKYFKLYPLLNANECAYIDCSSLPRDF